MTKNVGKSDRILRGIAATALLAGSVVAPLPLAIRVMALGGLAAYMAFTALAGTCIGYRIVGKSTCLGSTSR